MAIAISPTRAAGRSRWFPWLRRGASPPTTGRQGLQSRVAAAFVGKFKGAFGLNAVGACIGLGIIGFDLVQLCKNITSMFYCQDLFHAYEKDQAHKLTKSNLKCLKELFTLKSGIDVVGLILETAAFLGLGPKTGAVLISSLYLFTEWLKKVVLDEDNRHPAIIGQEPLNSPSDNQQTSIPQPPPPPALPPQMLPTDGQNNTSNTQGDDNTQGKAIDNQGVGSGFPVGAGPNGLTGAGDGAYNPYGRGGGGGGGPVYINVSPVFSPTMNPYAPNNITRTG